MDRLLTLIGIKLAKKNREFLFSGPAKECDQCDPSLKSVCIGNLQKGCIYKIIKIRKIKHPCAVHEEGVCVVEVQKVPIKTAIEAKLAYEGAIITFNFPDCNEVSCTNYKYCRPLGLIKEDKYKILKVLDNLPHLCEKGKKLKLVEMI